MSLSFKVTIAVTLTILPHFVRPFSWSNCESEKPLLLFDSLSFAEDPLVVGDRARPIELSFKANLTGPLDDKVIAQVSIAKAVTIFGKRFVLPGFPCIKGYGSCDQNFCSYFTSPENSFGCPLLQKINRPCSCPIEPGLLAIDHFKGHMDLSNVPKMLLWLSSGDYNVKLTLISDGQSVACVDVNLDLEMTNVTHEQDGEEDHEKDQDED